MSRSCLVSRAFPAKSPPRRVDWVLCVAARGVSDLREVTISRGVEARGALTTATRDDLERIQTALSNKDQLRLRIGSIAGDDLSVGRQCEQNGRYLHFVCIGYNVATPSLPCLSKCKNRPASYHALRYANGQRLSTFAHSQYKSTVYISTTHQHEERELLSDPMPLKGSSAEL